MAYNDDNDQEWSQSMDFQKYIDSMERRLEDNRSRMENQLREDRAASEQRL